MTQGWAAPDDFLRKPAMTPEMSDESKVQFAAEIAFNSLIFQAKKLGLSVGPVMGLVYLPNQQDTADFQDVCSRILKSLAI